MDSNQSRARCEDCYFHRASLCALRLEEACPTFRHHARGPLVDFQPFQAAPRRLDDVLRERRLARTAAA